MLYYPSKGIYIPPQKMNQNPQEVFFKNEDGIKLHGWHFQNTVQPKKPKAVLVFFHGNAQNISSHYLTLLWILKKGYDYFIFDYQGFGESEGEPSPKNTVKDGKAALAWTKQNLPGVPVVIFGQSLGGAVALRVAGEIGHDVPVKLIVADSTFHSYKVVARRVLAKHWLTWILQPFTYFVLSDAYAPEDYIEKIAPIPILVIHGDQDQVVPYELGQKVFSLAKDPKEFWSVRGGRHTDAFWKDEDTYRIQFLDKLKSVGL